ncbi:MAG: hypothetical protein JWM68_5258 [Verrucomicrobiales bacterium]|nr:hypothetical protein [Verrucomicrobiales bacterium]
MVILVITIAYFRSRKHSDLPVVGQVTEFTLTNQLGQAVSLQDLRGRVWIADIIFTRCPAQCLQMTKNMRTLQAQLSHHVQLLSLTADPAFDTPGILKAYAKRVDATDNWMFLTGSKSNVYHLAMNGLGLSAEETTPAERQSLDDLFIHSKKFMLVDKRGRLRGVMDKNKNISVGFDGDEATSNPEIIAAVEKLMREK